MNEKIKCMFIGFFSGVVFVISCLFRILFRKNKSRITSDVGKELNRTEELCKGFGKSLEQERDSIEGEREIIEGEREIIDRIKSTVAENERILQEFEKRTNNRQD